LCGEFVEGVNDLSSEFVKSINDLSEDTLVGEVLAECQLEECLDHGALLNSLPGLLGDLLNGGTELLDLDQGGVGEGLNQSEGLIDSGSGVVEFFNLSLVFGVLLLTEEGVLVDGLSVESDVLVDRVDFVLDLLSSGVKQVVQDVLHAGNVGNSVLDVLLQLDHQSVVLVSSLLEVEL
jgi:hypothetical protein